ncbi:MAG: polysaccharide biosynthesis protein [Nitrospinae bacterium]|nr:polysaccharide biosynthesis protein [Nitrospinota bacterium]
MSVQVLLFGISISITRYLGKERLGIYATILVIPALARLLNSFGLETALNKKLPELAVADPSLGQSRYAARRILSLRVVSALTFCLVLYYALPYYFALIRMPELLVYRLPVLLYFFLTAVNSILSSLFMTCLKYKITSMAETLCSLLNLAFLSVFIFLDRGIQGILYAYILSVGATVAVYGYLARPYLAGTVLRADWGDARKLAGVSYLVGILSFGLMTQSDVAFMNYFQVDAVRIGYYHLATGVAGMLTFVLAGIGPLALSIFSETFSREGPAGLSKSWRQILGFTLFIAIPIYIFALFYSRPLIGFVYGEQFVKSGDVLSFYLVFMTAGAVLGSGFSSSALYVLQRRDIVLKASLEGSALNVVLDIALIPFYGEMGAAGATGLATLYMAFRQFLCICQAIRVRPIFLFAGKCFLLSFAAVAPSLALSAMGHVHVLLSLLVFIGVFLSLLLWRKPLPEEYRRFMEGTHPILGRWAGRFVRNAG